MTSVAGCSAVKFNHFYEPWTMNDCFFSDSDAAMPRQTQADNDASGSPQRVAGRPPLLSVLATVLHLPMVGTWWSERLWDGPYGCAIPRQTQADNDALGSPQRVAGRPLGQPLRNRSQAMGTVCRWQAARFYRTQKDTAIGRMRRGRPNGRPA